MSGQIGGNVAVDDFGALAEPGYVTPRGPRLPAVQLVSGEQNALNLLCDAS
jgi:hypothetical protein